MTDYRKLVPREAPVGILSYASEALGTAGMVYAVEWIQDTSVHATLTNPGKKQKAVRCTCSECGRSALLDYAPPVHGYTGSKSNYGFYHPEDPMRDAIRHGDDTLCLVCGTPVKVMCASAVGRGEFASSEVNVMSASLLPGEPGERPLVLTGWEVRRLVNRYGMDRYAVRPLEAYVFERDLAYKLPGWVNGYSGSAGYFLQVCNEWRQPKEWSETWGRVSGIFGLTHELVAESCLCNSAFDVYMEDAAWRGKKSPVVYIRSYQAHPQIENLVVQGCCNLLDGLFDEAVTRSTWDNNKKAAVDLSEINLAEKRPSKMLGLTKDEFRVMQDQCWDLYHWRVFVKAKAVGDRMRLPEDITLLHQYGAEDIEEIIGKAPVGKTLRYLLHAMQEWGTANDPYNEYADYMPDEDQLTATTLSDYWSMAETAGWDLSDPRIKWPKNLIAAHDRAMAASKVVLTKSMATAFRKRAHELERFAYTSGPLLIRPAACQSELTQEGDIQAHCVAGYGEDVALGKTAIFLIRHTWEPASPYFTLEYDEQKEEVKQNRGKKNCARTPEVEAFEAEWLAWIKAGCRRNKDGTPVGAKPVETEDPAKKRKETAA